MFFFFQINCSESSLKPQKNTLCLSSSDQSSEDDFVSLPCSSSSSTSVSSAKSPRTMPGSKRTLDRTSWLSPSNNPREDVSERERQRWKEFREKKMLNRASVLGLRLKKPQKSQTEPSESKEKLCELPGAM